MLKIKQKSILLYLVLGLSLLTGVISLTGTYPARASSNNLPPGCWDVKVENGSIDVGFFIDDVTGVYNATEFYSVGNLDAFYNDSTTFLSNLNATVTNHYNISTSTFNGTWIYGITLPDGTDVVAVIITDFNELLAVDDACPPPPPDPICNNFQRYIVHDGKLEVVQLRLGDSLRAIYKLDEFNWSQYDADPEGYIVNATIPNYLSGVNTDGQWLLNIDSTLNDMHVIVVFADVDNNLQDVDGYCEYERCEDYREFIVKEGRIDVPPLGTDVSLDDIELLGIFKLDEFDFYMFDMDPEGYLTNNSAFNYVMNATLEKGGISGLLGTPTLQGVHVVIVFQDNSAEGMGHIEARSGFCNDQRQHDGPLVDSITYGVKEGVQLVYDIGITGFGDEPVPFLGIQDSQGNEFMVSNGEQLFVTFVEVPDPQHLTISTPSLDSKLVQDPNQNDDNNLLGIFVDLESGNSAVTKEEGTLFAIPVEYLQLAVEGISFYEGWPCSTDPVSNTAVVPPTKMQNDTQDSLNNDQCDGPGFNPFETFSHDETSVTFEGGDDLLSIKVTYHRDTGVMMRAEFSGTPPDSPAGTTGSLILELATDLADIGHGTTSDKSSDTSDGGFQSSVPGFEVLFLMIGFLSLAVINRRH